MRYFFFIVLWVTILSTLSLTPLYSRVNIREEVKVEWWVLPLFAVDKRDQSVTDLEQDDLELYIDNQKIENFVLYQKSFNVPETVPGSPGDGGMTPALKKGQIVFLLFDRVLTGWEAIHRAKTIAENIVAHSRGDIRFVILTIEPGKGLNYKAGPLIDKRKAAGIIKGINGRAKATGKSFKMQSIPFFNSFETLYYNVNSIKDHKFIYLFSEGIPGFQQDMGKGNIYYPYLKKMAEQLGRCGAVFFVINPSGGADTLSPGSPESVSRNAAKASLEFLAKESGGIYLQGTKDKVSNRIADFHRSYYEIAFQGLPEIKGNIYRVRMEAKRKGIYIYTLNTVERSKSYAEMSDIEKEILVLNLVSQNPLYYTHMVPGRVAVEKKSRGKKEVAYEMKIPDNFLYKKIDVYQVFTDASGTIRIKKETHAPKKNKINIRFSTDDEAKIYFTLSDGSSALIEGPRIDK